MSWKYWNDDEYRKAKLEYGRKKALEWIRNKLKEDPKFNARRQMKFRKKHPDSFNFIMARYYWRKLSAEKKAELIRRFP